MCRNLASRPSESLTEFQGIYTRAPQMLAFFELVKRAARSDSAVLIRGETGTGKELVARALHELSPRRRGPFRAINCATLTPELLGSELFGHVRGAFTGAVHDRQGLFELANGGSVFLDEVAEISLELQARLLRVLQEQTFVPLGGREPIQVNVRVLSATHRALRDEIERHRFREDLMYRIRVVPLFLPRLAERDGDVEALTWQFIDQFNARGLRHVDSVERSALDAMLAYAWPGNVRELRNVIEFAFAVGEGPTLTLGELTPELRGEPPPDSPKSASRERDLEREQLVAALRKANGRKSRAAELLGISRSTLWRRMREHRISD